jgi:hypothetical protein
MIHKQIAATTATVPSGLPAQDRLFRVAAGPFTGRIVAIFARTPSVLAWSRSDPPYTEWTEPIDCVIDAADESFTAMMDEKSDIYAVYTQQDSFALRCVKLTFANGTWVTQTPSTVFTSGSSANTHPSLVKDQYGRIWVVWTKDESGPLSLRVKSSVDGGQTFGSGPSDDGTDLTGSVTSCTGQLIAQSSYLHCLFTTDGTTLKDRKIHIDAAFWDSPGTLYTGTGLGTDFNAALSADNTLGVLFVADSSLLLREFDGSVWGAIQTVAAESVTSPALQYVKTAPYALALKEIGNNQYLLRESHRTGGSFTSPNAVFSQLALFTTVFCYDADSGAPYADLTAEAASQTGADVFHPASGALMSESGDAVHCGSEDRFSLVRLVLSTAGAGGTVTWNYWNGAEWTPFVPDSGACHFDATNTVVRLFPDTASSPATWQKSIVNGLSRYWIRAVVATPFTTPPIGSQLTAVAETTHVVPLRL